MSSEPPMPRVCSSCFARIDSVSGICLNCRDTPTLPEDRSRGLVEKTDSRRGESFPNTFAATLYPREFEAVLDRRLRVLILGEHGEKSFEVGDGVFVREVSPEKSIPTGRSVLATITHSSRGTMLGLAPWIAVLSISIDETDRPADLRERFR